MAETARTVPKKKEWPSRKRPGLARNSAKIRFFSRFWLDFSDDGVHKKARPSRKRPGLYVILAWQMLIFTPSDKKKEWPSRKRPGHSIEYKRIKY